jgi:hypothetical protein
MVISLYPQLLLERRAASDVRKLTAMGCVK